MKIAHLIPQFYPYIGGAEICVHNVCNTLAASGHEAFVITTTPPPSVAPQLNYNIIRISAKTGGMFRHFPKIGKLYLHFKLSQLQKKYRFDLWQVTMGYPLGVYAVDFFRKNKIPCILRCCGEDIQKYPEISYGYRLNSDIDGLVTAKYPLYDGLVALTPSVKEEYLKIGIAGDKIRIISNGVNNGIFSNVSSERIKELRKEFCPSEDTKIILTVGRYHPKKGFDLIPEIAKELKNRGIKFVWLVLGKNTSGISKKFKDCEKYGIKCIEKYSGSNNEDKFMLPTKGLVEIYKSADIFALPTLIETFGMVLVEAMAAGLPIITTDAPGVKDVISEGINGIKVKANDVRGFADGLERLLAENSLSEKLRANALNEALKRYDWSIVTGQYCDYYKYVINKKR